MITKESHNQSFAKLVSDDGDIEITLQLSLQSLLSMGATMDFNCLALVKGNSHYCSGMILIPQQDYYSIIQDNEDCDAIVKVLMAIYKKDYSYMPVHLSQNGSYFTSEDFIELVESLR